MKNNNLNRNISFLQQIESYLFGVKLKTYRSELHGDLEIWMINGKLVLNSAHANQSYDSLHRIFQYCFKKIKPDLRPACKTLLLGLGVGSVPAIIEEELQMQCPVIAVENDPVMLEVGEQYFNIHRFQHLQVIHDDALHFVHECREKYGLIIVDLFADDRVPEVFTGESFLQQLIGLMEPGAMLLFNMIVKMGSQQKQFEGVSSFFQKQGGIFQVLSPVSVNKVVCWKKSE